MNASDVAAYLRMKIREARIAYAMFGPSLAVPKKEKSSYDASYDDGSWAITND